MTFNKLCRSSESIFGKRVPIAPIWVLATTSNGPRKQAMVLDITDVRANGINTVPICMKLTLSRTLSREEG